MKWRFWVKDSEELHIIPAFFGIEKDKRYLIALPHATDEQVNRFADVLRRLRAGEWVVVNNEFQLVEIVPREEPKVETTTT